MDTDTGDASIVKEVVDETIEEDGKAKNISEGANMSSSEDDALLEGAGEDVDGKISLVNQGCGFSVASASIKDVVILLVSIPPTSAVAPDPADHFRFRFRFRFPGPYSLND